MYSNKPVIGRCDDILKWKPAELNSIDFKLKITKQGGVGMLPKSICNLLVSGERRELKCMTQAMKYTKDVKQYDNKIIECKINMKTKLWEIMRERKDKSFPNHITTAQAVMHSITNPVTKDMLLQIIERLRYRTAQSRRRTSERAQMGRVTQSRAPLVARHELNGAISGQT